MIQNWDIDGANGVVLHVVCNLYDFDNIVLCKDLKTRSVDVM